MTENEIYTIIQFQSQNLENMLMNDAEMMKNESKCLMKTVKKIFQIS